MARKFISRAISKSYKQAAAPNRIQSAFCYLKISQMGSIKLIQISELDCYHKLQIIGKLPILEQRFEFKRLKISNLLT